MLSMTFAVVWSVGFMAAFACEANASGNNGLPSGISLEANGTHTDGRFDTETTSTVTTARGRQEFSRLLLRHKPSTYFHEHRLNNTEGSPSANTTESTEESPAETRIFEVNLEDEHQLQQLESDLKHFSEKDFSSSTGKDSAAFYPNLNQQSVHFSPLQPPLDGLLSHPTNTRNRIAEYLNYLNNLYKKDLATTGRTRHHYQTTAPEFHTYDGFRYPSSNIFPFAVGDVDTYLLQAIRNATALRPAFGGVTNEEIQHLSIFGGKIPENLTTNLIKFLGSSHLPAAPNLANANEGLAALQNTFPDNSITQLPTSNNPPLTLSYLSNVLENLLQEPIANARLTTPTHQTYPNANSNSFPYSSTQQNYNTPEKDLILYLYKRCQQNDDVHHIPDNIFWDIVSQLSTPFPKVTSVLRQKRLFNIFDHFNLISESGGEYSRANSARPFSDARSSDDLDNDNFESIHECMKDTWCGLGLAATFTIGTGSAVAVPIFSPLDLGRRKRTIDYVVLSPDTATNFTNNYLRLLRNESFNVPESLKLLFTALHDANDDSARNVFRQIEQFIKSNKEKLLYITIEEIKSEKNISYENIPSTFSTNHTSYGTSMEPNIPARPYSRSDLHNLNVFSDESGVYNTPNRPSQPAKYSFDLNRFHKTSLTPLFINYAQHSPKVLRHPVYQVPASTPPPHPYLQHRPNPTPENLNKFSSICDTLLNNRGIVKALLGQLSLISTDYSHHTYVTQPQVTSQPSYQYTVSYINRPIATPSQSYKKPVSPTVSQIYQTPKPVQISYDNHNQHPVNIQQSYTVPVKTYSHKFSASHNTYHPLNYIDHQATSTAPSTERPSTQGSDILNHLGTQYSSILLNLPLQFNPLHAAHQSTTKKPQNPHHFVTSSHHQSPQATNYPPNLYPFHSYHPPNPVYNTPAPLHAIPSQNPSTTSSYTEYHYDQYQVPHIQNKYNANFNNNYNPAPVHGSDILVIPPGKTKPNISLQAKGFYRSVCAAVAKDDVPDNEIIRFIAEKCAIFQYAGIV